MKAIVCTMLMLMSGIAFAKDAKLIDADCNKMATNAKGFAELKQGGIASTAEELTKFVVTPSVASYPIRSVLEYVLNASDPAPDQIYASLYTKCTMMGYKELFTYFQEREQVAGYKVQIAEQNMTIAQLRAQVSGLTQQVSDLKYPPAPQKHGRLVIPPPAPVAAAIPQVYSPHPTTETPIGCTRQDGKPCGTQK